MRQLSSTLSLIAALGCVSTTPTTTRDNVRTLIRHMPEAPSETTCEQATLEVDIAAMQCEAIWMRLGRVGDILSERCDGGLDLLADFQGQITRARTECREALRRDPLDRCKERFPALDSMVARIINNLPPKCYTYHQCQTRVVDATVHRDAICYE